MADPSTLSIQSTRISHEIRVRSPALSFRSSRRVPRAHLLSSFVRRSCSSADINPIGGISKTDLKRFIAYGVTAFDMPILDRSVSPPFLSSSSPSCGADSCPLLGAQSFLTAVPTAELEPITENYVQADEVGSFFAVFLFELELTRRVSLSFLLSFVRFRPTWECPIKSFPSTVD